MLIGRRSLIDDHHHLLLYVNLGEVKKRGKNWKHIGRSIFLHWHWWKILQGMYHNFLISTSSSLILETYCDHHHPCEPLFFLHRNSPRPCPLRHRRQCCFRVRCWERRWKSNWRWREVWNRCGWILLGLQEKEEEAIGIRSEKNEFFFFWFF